VTLERATRPKRSKCATTTQKDTACLPCFCGILKNHPLSTILARSTVAAAAACLPACSEGIRILESSGTENQVI
jgi:hypothetical protein